MSRRYALILSISILFVASFGITVASDTDIVINEIMYNPASSQGDDWDYEYVELYNRGSEPVDVEDWTIEDVPGTVDKLTETSTDIPPWSYAVITDDSGAVSVPGTAIHLIVDGLIGSGLNNGGDTLVLKNSSGTVIDTVVFDNSWGADGTGSSLELIDPSNDNNDSSNWAASTPADNYGTPGVRNSTYRFTWTGSTSSAWNDNGNWEPSWEPSTAYPQSAEDNVVIADVVTDPVLNVDVSVNNLTDKRTPVE